MSSDPDIRYTVVPFEGKISLDFQVQIDGLQQLYLSLKTPVYICGPERNTDREQVLMKISQPHFLLFSLRCSASDLYILRFVSLTVIISTTGGILTTLLKGCLAKRFLTDRRPRSATMTLEEEEDCGRKITGALKSTFKAIRLLLSASSFTPVAAFSAAWAVTSTKASLASWKLLIKACNEKKI